MSAQLRQSGPLRARRAGHNPRQVRLAIEYTNLMNLAARSDFIRVEPVDVQPGWPPEKYVVTYTCRGIAGIEEDGSPVFGELHQVKMYLPSDYPLREPLLKWMTPIWHPNIDHREPHHVCLNTVQNYFAGKPLSDLVRAMGEMVQYARYHAVWAPPYPLDREAARWVVEVAEPAGIVSKTKPVDDRPLLRPQRMRLHAGGAETPEAAEAAPERPKRIRVGRAPAEEPAPAEKTRPREDRQGGPTRKITTRRLRELSAAILSERMSRALDVFGLRPRAGHACGACSTHLPEHARFCPRCGVAAPEPPPTCWSCFKELPSQDTRFCPRCGVPVRGMSPGGELDGGRDDD